MKRILACVFSVLLISSTAVTSVSATETYKGDQKNIIMALAGGGGSASGGDDGGPITP